MPGKSSFRFATLTPENAAARKSLDLSVVRHLQHDPESSVSPVEAVLVSREATHRAALSRYQLDLCLHRQPGHGAQSAWVVGKFDPKAVLSVDLPICAARSRQLKGPRFCQIFIHPISGVLVLRNTNAFHPIVYLQGNGYSDVELACGQEHVLHMSTNHLRIGPLDFVLSISVDDETAYLTSRNDYMREWHEDWDYYSPVRDRLDPLPRPKHACVGDIIVHRTVGQGAFGVVRVGVNRWSGNVVAHKTIHCSHNDVETINNEIDIASKVVTNTVGLVHLIGSSCRDGLARPCSETDFQDVHLTMPFAPFSFDTTVWHEISLDTRLGLFRQVLEGLANLHTAGIMHRDISPKNLLVFSYQPPVAAICDFGKSKYGTKGTGASLGPSMYMAPEPARQEEYTNAIDIFSMGLSILASFRQPRWVGPLSDPRNHVRVLEQLASLQSRMPDELAVLLRSMLAWDPADRPTAEQALASKIWERVAVVGPGSEFGSASETSNSEISSGLGPSSTGATGGNDKRFRRSDAPSRSEEHPSKRPRRSEPAGQDVREQGLRSSGSLLPPPPV